MIANVDWDILRAVADLRSPVPDAVFEALSSSWSRVAFVAAAVVAELVGRRRFPLFAVAVAVSIGLASAVTAPLKALFDRARPAVADPSFTTLVPTPGDGAMPSGHASTAFAAATCLALLHPRLAPPAFVLATLVAASRVWLGVHYPSDVLAGAALGAALGAAVALAARRLRARWAAEPLDRPPDEA